MIGTRKEMIEFLRDMYYSRRARTAAERKSSFCSHNNHDSTRLQQHHLYRC